VAERIVVLGVPSSSPLPDAALFVGGRRHLAAAGLPSGAAVLEIGSDLDAVLDAIAAAPATVCVLASGDPGFFGIGRLLAQRFGPEVLDVYPAPSSVSLAFARVGLPWDDAVVVSAHGRSLAAAAAAVADATKAAVLVSPASPPEALGKELLARQAAPAQVVVCSRLGLAGEAVAATDLDGLAAGSWDPLSIVLLLRAPPVAGGPQTQWAAEPEPAAAGPPGAPVWGRPEALFAHRDGMVTKGEVRAIVLAKLQLPHTGVMWDVGAGSGSVAIESALLRPALAVFAIERRPDDAQRIRDNARSLGAEVTVVEGTAPDALVDLPAPERAFVGGGGIDVLDTVVARMRPGGHIVATYAAVDRAAVAAERLGQLVQVAANRGERLPDGGWRLAADNPVFVAWGAGRQ
jgi:precorrin-6Y C5,15-methyltransferase (decarboxylating)